MYIFCSMACFQSVSVLLHCKFNKNGTVAVIMHLVSVLAKDIEICDLNFAMQSCLLLINYGIILQRMIRLRNMLMM